MEPFNLMDVCKKLSESKKTIKLKENIKSLEWLKKSKPPPPKHQTKDEDKEIQHK